MPDLKLHREIIVCTLFRELKKEIILLRSNGFLMMTLVQKRTIERVG